MAQHVGTLIYDFVHISSYILTEAVIGYSWLPVSIAIAVSIVSCFRKCQLCTVIGTVLRPDILVTGDLQSCILRRVDYVACILDTGAR